MSKSPIVRRHGAWVWRRLRALPGLAVIELRTGHCPMVTQAQHWVQQLPALAAR